MSTVNYQGVECEIINVKQSSDNLSDDISEAVKNRKVIDIKTYLAEDQKMAAQVYVLKKQLLVEG